MRSRSDAGWSSLVARWAHNPKVAGSNPAPATNLDNSAATASRRQGWRKLPAFLLFGAARRDELEPGESQDPRARRLRPGGYGRLPRAAGPQAAGDPDPQ